MAHPSSHTSAGKTPVGPGAEPLLEQFRRFARENPCDSMETLFDRFALFGGSGLRIDMTLSEADAIRCYILDDYARLSKSVHALTGGDADAHALLSGIALGDRRMHSALKRARLSDEAGTAALDTLREAGVVRREKARPNRFSWIESDTISDRLHIVTPFLRFWFAFVSPIYRGIKAGEYGEFETRYANHAAGFSDTVFEALGMELIREEFEGEDPVTEIGGYWDHKVTIDVIAKTASGKTIAASCRNVGSKLKKSELTHLKAACESAGFKPDIYVLIARSGFSNELRSLKGDGVRLLALRHFKKLL